MPRLCSTVTILLLGLHTEFKLLFTLLPSSFRISGAGRSRAEGGLGVGNYGGFAHEFPEGDTFAGGHFAAGFFSGPFDGRGDNGLCGNGRGQGVSISQVVISSEVFLTCALDQLGRPGLPC